MMALVIFGIGVWMLQDGLASIAYYPQEKMINHAARIVRSALGLVLIIIGGILV
jgi:hypothetical protein